MADADSDVRNPVATQRFLELVESMGEAREHRRGWKREVADVMGLAPSHLSKILVGERGVGVDLIRRLAKIDGLPGLDYFLGAVPYSQYQSEGLRAFRAVPPATIATLARAIMAKAGKDGEPMTVEAATNLAHAVKSLEMVRNAEEVLAAEEKERPRLALELARLVVFSLNAKEK